MPRLIFPKSFFGDPIDMPFENVSMKCPCNYDKYLTFQFGDYMTPPPVKEQQIHGGLIDVNRPFTYYVDKEPVASI